MYRILMPVDTDVDRALSQAEYVAKLPNAADRIEVIILFVFHGEGQQLPDELKSFKSAVRIDSVNSASDFLRKRGIAVKVIDESGNTTDDILAESESFEVDSIVLGTRKRSPIGKAIFGSVTQSVIRNTDLPVVITSQKPQ